MKPDTEHVTDRRVEVEHTEEGDYVATVEGTGHIFAGSILNVGGRAAAFPPGGTLEFGGGETDIVVREYRDGRADNGQLLAIGFDGEPVCL